MEKDYDAELLYLDKMINDKEFHRLLKRVYGVLVKNRIIKDYKLRRKELLKAISHNQHNAGV